MPNFSRIGICRFHTKRMGRAITMRSVSTSSPYDRFRLMADRRSSSGLPPHSARAKKAPRSRQAVILVIEVPM